MLKGRTSGKRTENDPEAVLPHPEELADTVSLLFFCRRSPYKLSIRRCHLVRKRLSACKKVERKALCSVSADSGHKPASGSSGMFFKIIDSRQLLKQRVQHRFWTIDECTKNRLYNPAGTLSNFHPPTGSCWHAHPRHSSAPPFRSPMRDRRSGAQTSGGTRCSARACR